MTEQLLNLDDMKVPGRAISAGLPDCLWGMKNIREHTRAMDTDPVVFCTGYCQEPRRIIVK